MNRKFGVLISAAALLCLSVSATAQQFSDSFTFLKAVRDRDGNKATELLAQPGSTVVNTKDRTTGDTALHIVIRDRDSTWLSFLLSKGARPDIQNKDGETPLGLAAQIGWVEGADLLIARKADVNQGNNRGETPLMFAVQRRDLPMVRTLLSAGADPDKTDSVTGYSALDYAKQDRRTAAILRLLESKTKP